MMHSVVRQAGQVPNPRIQLDETLQEVLKSAEMSAAKLKAGHVQHSAAGPSMAHELEVLEFDESWEGHDSEELDGTITETVRKSSRAAFGSQSIGSVFLPSELQGAIEKLINGTKIYNPCFCSDELEFRSRPEVSVTRERKAHLSR